MPNELRVGNLTAGKGTKASGHLDVPGTDVKIPVTLVNGAGDGPRIAITGGIHGGEYPGIEAAARLANDLDPAEVNGQIIIVRVSNPPAFFARSIYVGPLDGKNLNRVFPGNAEGTASDRMAYVLFNEVILGSDYYMDLHGGDMIEKLTPFSLYSPSPDPRVTARSQELARVYGIPYAVLSDSSGGTYGAAARAGIPSILAEAGGVGILDEESVQIHLAGLTSVLRKYGAVSPETMFSAESPKDGPVTFLSSSPVLRSDVRGMLYLTVDTGDFVTKGQHVGVIKDCLGNVLRHLASPATGPVLYTVTSLATNPNDPVLSIGVE